ncbi:MAG: hypothetical protein IKZ46_05330 [Victivallales bacterium]|nr:hypothetical protein [Victivallales bacterium]
MTNKKEHIIDDDRLQGVLIDSDAIHARIETLAQEIKDAYAGETCVCLMGVLKGASIFVSDLIRELRTVGMRGLHLDFVRASTYQSGMKGTGEKTRKVKISGMTCDNVEGCSILLVDDILDQGFTLSALKDYFLTELKAKSVKTCVFLEKKLESPSPEVLELRKHFKVDFKGFEVNDRWVVGYGLDVGEEFRDLPYVALAREECFR